MQFITAKGKTVRISEKLKEVILYGIVHIEVFHVISDSVEEPLHDAIQYWISSGLNVKVNGVVFTSED